MLQRHHKNVWSTADTSPTTNNIMNNSSSSNKNNIHKSRLWFLDLLRAVAKRKTQLEAPCMYGEQESRDKLLACLNRSLIENKLVENGDDWEVSANVQRYSSKLIYFIFFESSVYYAGNWKKCKSYGKRNSHKSRKAAKIKIGICK